MLPAETQIIILYTAALNGNLALLPHLMMRIKIERAQIAAVPTFLVDVGRACQPDSWICEATGGLGMLVAMDGMGYDSFHIGAKDALYTQPQTVQRLRETIATPLAAGPWIATARRGDLLLAFGAKADFRVPEQPTLSITLRHSDSPQTAVSYRDGQRRFILDAGGDQRSPTLGRIDLRLLPDDPFIVLENHQILDIPDGLPPDPTMSSVIEFVESEARRYTIRQESRNEMD